MRKTLDAWGKEKLMSTATHPALKLTVSCQGPGCSAVRRDCNHWWVVFVVGDVFSTEPYHEGYELQKRDRVVCGDSCAMKLFQEFLKPNEKRA